MEFKRFTTKNIIINLILVGAYLLWNKFIGAIRNEHYFLIVLWLVAFYAHEKSRKFILGFSVFIIFWIVYDSMRLVPNYKVSTVHIKEPYDFEKKLFGILLNGQQVTPNEYFAQINNRFLDFLAGFFYLNWMPVPIGFGIYLFVKDKYLFLKYAMAFLFVNLIGFTIYYLYPAAPPWYVELYGFDLHIGVPGNRAGLIRFDNLVGVPVFANIYNKNANVLAAMPSLHSAYPVIVLYFAIKKGVSLTAKILFSAFMFGIWFAAVYSGHHYLIDVLAGIIVAILGLFLFERICNIPEIQYKIVNFSRII